MIDIELLHEYLNTLGLPMEVYLFLFPDENQYEIDVADIQDAIAFSLKTETSNPVIERTNMRFLIRSGHPLKCLEAGNLLIKALDLRTDVVIGDTQIVLFKAVDKTPEAMGLDNNNNNIFKVDITVVASPLN